MEAKSKSLRLRNPNEIMAENLITPVLSERSLSLECYHVTSIYVFDEIMMVLEKNRNQLLSIFKALYYNNNILI